VTSKVTIGPALVTAMLTGFWWLATA
jgi:hypothetical protein